MRPSLIHAEHDYEQRHNYDAAADAKQPCREAAEGADRERLPAHALSLRRLSLVSEPGLHITNITPVARNVWFKGRVRTGLCAAALASLLLPASPAQAENPLNLSLERISPWVGEGRPFQIDVRIRNQTGQIHRGVSVQVRLLTPVSSRSSLRSALNGELRGTVASLSKSDLNIDQSSLVRFEATRVELNSLSLGVYPVSVQITDPDGEFIELRTAVPVIAQAPTSRIKALTVLDLVDPDPPVILGGGYDPETLDAAAMEARAERLDAWGEVPALVAVDGATLDAANDLRDGAITRTTDGDLADLDPSGAVATSASKLLASLLEISETARFAHQPYVPIDPGALAASRAVSRIGRQFRQGATTVRARLSDPTHVTLVDDLSDSAHYPASVTSFLGSPDQISSVDGAPFSPELFGTSTPLAVDGRRLLVSDERLTELGAGELGWLLSAQAIVAETAMRWLELPDSSPDRLIVFAPPTDVSPRLLSLVSNSFADAPWLNNVLPADAGVPEGIATPSQPSEPVQTLSLAVPAATRSLRAIRSIIPPDAGPVAIRRIREWEDGILISERVTPEGVGDTALADAIRMDIESHLDRISTPAGRRVTLTSRSGEIPIVVENGNDFPVNVQVHLGGERLKFPQGDKIDVRLEPGGGTVDAAVEVFSQGTFQLEVAVLTPSGIVLGNTAVNLHSTQVSRVAFLVVAGALVFLFLQAWRKGRRARKFAEHSVPSAS